MPTKKIGMPIKPFVAMDYAAVVEALRTNQLEVAFLGPAYYPKFPLLMSIIVVI